MNPIINNLIATACAPASSRSKSLASAKLIWDTAYMEGVIILDQTGQPGAEAITKKLHKYLDNYRLRKKSRRLDNLALVERMEACMMRRVTPTMLKLYRRKFTSTQQAVEILLTQAVAKALPESAPRGESVLKLFVANYCNGVPD